MAQKHWEAVTLPPISQMFEAMSKGFPISYSSISTIAPVKDRRQYDQMSPNHWDMALSGRLFWSAVYGTPSEYDLAQECTLTSLALHLDTIGLWTSEQFTGLPHGGFYLATALGWRAGARYRKDTYLLSRLDLYFQRLMSYLVLTSTPGGAVWCCGERMPGGPAAPQQSAFLRELWGLPHKGEIGSGGSRDRIGVQGETALQGDAWVFLRGLRLLLASGDNLGGIQSIHPDSPSISLPLTARRIEVMRWKGGHLAQYIDPIPAAKAGGVCDWVLCDHAEVDRGQESRKDLFRGVKYGIEFKTGLSQITSTMVEKTYSTPKRG
jgi:hypothetical protein